LLLVARQQEKDTYVGDGNWFIRLDRSVLKPFLTRKTPPGGGHGGHQSDEQELAPDNSHHNNSNTSSSHDSYETDEQVIELNTISVLPTTDS
jgi:hypothetical protein